MNTIRHFFEEIIARFRGGDSLETAAVQEVGDRSAVPKSGQEAHSRLHEILQKVSTIQGMEQGDFLCGWNAMAYIAPSLDPDEAEMEDGGWPVAWVPVAVEAGRRFKLKELTKDEFYASPALS